MPLPIGFDLQGNRLIFPTMLIFHQVLEYRNEVPPRHNSSYRLVIRELFPPLGTTRVVSHPGGLGGWTKPDLDRANLVITTQN